ncbi:flavohemoglobin expression-modulating QEGLA motif protein [Rickettsiales bacterium]|nr:flavohemoglobin expression-modulating QEGLA motif protein [Rickettsiales bacterium]
MNNSWQKIQQFDGELVGIIKDFLLLNPLSWPKEDMYSFLNNCKKKNLKLPDINYPKIDYSDKIKQLCAFINKLEKEQEPALVFLKETADSYLSAYRILQGVGTKDVTEFSRKLYGSPSDKLTGYTRRSQDIARYFLRIVDQYHFALPEEELIYSASQFRDALFKNIKKYICPKKDPISVTVDEVISSRAAAGSNYVKIRKGARFSEKDLDQLFHHEVMIHTLTYINGRKQPILKILGYNAPRTTATQEGLAVFAEYINLSIEMVRLKRIALRIIAIGMAEKGADFIDLYKFYLKNGQNEEESYYSAMRIFRGGYPKGGIVFYKDNVYLRGLIEVGSFLKHAMHQGFIHDINLLFCGKLTTSDVLRLKPFASEGGIIDSAYLPEWVTRSGELAAHLVVNDLTERFKLKG